MEKKDVETIMKRIKYNYNEFIVDSYSISEWYKELKDYDLEDVMKKLEEHFKNEQYGQQPPKVYFLTKYLTKTKDKAKVHDFKVICSNCKTTFHINNYDEHMAKCNSIEYIALIFKKYKNQKIDKTKLFQMNNEQFEEFYNKTLAFVLSNTNDVKEFTLVNAILKNKTNELGLENI